MAERTTVYPLVQPHNVDVADTPVEVDVQGLTQTVESTTQEMPVEIIVPDTTIYTAGLQGPQGVPGEDGATLDADFFEYTATTGQTTFSGLDNNGDTLQYISGFVTVRLNGVDLGDQDYTATDGFSVVLAEPAFVDDHLEVFALGQTPTGGSASNLLQYIAGEDIGGHRVVRIDTGVVYYADKDTPTHINRVIGLTTGAVTNGNEVTVQASGEMEEPSWTWVAGPVYLGSNGIMTQTPPNAGFMQQVGVALTPTRLLIRVDDPLIRS